MAVRRTRAIHALLGACLALSSASCLPTIGDRVAEIRAKLIGVRARDLNACVGVPFNIDEDGETEFLTYRWIEQADPFDPPVTRGPRVPRAPRDPTDPAGGIGRDPLGRDPLDREERRKEDRPPRGVGYCELVFEVREGRVQSVEVEGRRGDGLNDDANCIAKAERCVPKK